MTKKKTFFTRTPLSVSSQSSHSSHAGRFQSSSVRVEGLGQSSHARGLGDFVSSHKFPSWELMGTYGNFIYFKVPMRFQSSNTPLMGTMGTYLGGYKGIILFFTQRGGVCYGLL